MRYKKDKYWKKRGSFAKIIQLKCKCGNILCTYQKDGKGVLWRLYFDRISESTMHHIDKVFVCSNCSDVVGEYMMYKKEKRPAIKRRYGKMSIGLLPSAMYHKLAPAIL